MNESRMRLGAVHVRVRDLARSEAFYTTTLGLSVSERAGAVLFMSNGDEHHVLALEAVGLESATDATQHVGLSRIGWEVADAWEFWRMHRQLQTARVQFSALDHGVRWALELRDPDGNGIEIYVDSRDLPGGRNRWDGVTRPVDENVILETLQAMIPGILEVEADEHRH